MIQQNEFMPAQWPYNINQRPYQKKKKKPENSNFLAKQTKCPTMAFAQETGECPNALTKSIRPKNYAKYFQRSCRFDVAIRH